MKKRAIFNWSGGKDSALALYKVLESNEYEIVSLLTTISDETQQSSMHLIPTGLLEQQAAKIDIPLYKVMLPSSGLEGYENQMKKAIQHFKEIGVTHAIFGDIFLSDVKSYRENQLRPYGIEVVEPLWNKSSDEVIEDFLASGIRTKIVVTQADKLDESFVGQDITRELINRLPVGVDPCGENGEYHTLVYDGPIFKQPLDFTLGKPQKLSYDIKLDSGETQTFEYWHTPIIE
ncbi:MAG: diphthine--ammonia ligase [Dysgonomonas sp.]|nr:diphthine--ammonia ligase [Dysgonomonas sp.]